MQRDALIVGGLFIVLVLVIALGPARAARMPGAGASSHSSGPQGALALYRWLEALGYKVDRYQFREQFIPDPDADLLIVLRPAERYTAEEAAAVAAWVKRGGVLLLADDRPGPTANAAPLFQAFELEVVAPPGGVLPDPVTPAQPVFSEPPVQRVTAATGVVLRTGRADVAPLLGDAAAPLVVGFQHGAGYVFASSTVYPYTNRGLSKHDNAAMTLNMLRRIPSGGRVVFDEYHHGFITTPSARTLLLGASWGWAILYAALIMGGYLALTGRRFGRAMPLREEHARRSSAEYLESMAGLLRRAGRRDAVQAHYRTWLKRRLARASGLPASLDDDAFLAALNEIAPARAAQASALLSRLTIPVKDDTTLLHLVADADRLVEQQ